MDAENLLEEQKQKFWKHIWTEVRDFCKWTIWDNIETFFYNLWWFFHNLRVFGQSLWDWRDWDHEYTKDLYIVCLKEHAKAIENGHEENRSAKKKVKKIHELIELLETDIYDITSDEIIAGRKKGIKEEKLQRRAREKQEAHINKILQIIKGPDYISFGKKYDEIAQKMKRDHPNKEIDSYEIWIRTFDGSGCENWWD